MVFIKFFENFEILNEDEGMGAIVSAQPSCLPGVTTGEYSGTTGSGDIGVPFNAGGGSMLSQKIPVMGREHSARTGKKSRTKKLDMKHLRSVLKSRREFLPGESSKKVMSFDDFKKDDFNKVTKVKENNGYEIL